MKPLIFLSLFVNSLFSQVDSSFRDKKEVFCGINRDISFNDNVFFGINTGYSSRIREEKNFYYRIDAQYTKRYFINTESNPHDAFYYEDLMVNSIVLNNMLSYRFYQKRHDRFYFELGVYLGINLWQEKNGQTDGYYQTEKDFNKTYFFLPNDVGIHFGCGVRVNKHILLKPELRFRTWSIDRLFEESGFIANMMRNTAIPVSFNISYLF